MARPKHVETFIQGILPIARKVRAEYGVPVSLCIAQAALESGWNLSNKSPFGHAIGGDPSKGFVKYKTLEDAAMAYGKNLRDYPGYKSAWAYKDDPDKFADAIGETYAPKQGYAKMVKSIIKGFNLKEYDVELVASDADKSGEPIEPRHKCTLYQWW